MKGIFNLDKAVAADVGVLRSFWHLNFRPLHRLPIFYSNVYSMVCFIKKFFFDNLQNKGTPDLECPEFNYRHFECA